MTPTEAATLTAELLESWPRAQVSPRLAAAYAEELAAVEPDVARAVIRGLRRTSKWLPTVAELVTAIEAIANPRGDADEQWGVVCEAIRRVGVYQPPPRFVDPVTALCVQRMGWAHLCKSTNDAADRAAFRKLYEGATDRDRLERAFGQPRTLGAPVRGFLGAVGNGGGS